MFPSRVVQCIQCFSATMVGNLFLSQGKIGFTNTSAKILLQNCERMSHVIRAVWMKFQCVNAWAADSPLWFTSFPTPWSWCQLVLANDKTGATVSLLHQILVCKPCPFQRVFCKQAWSCQVPHTLSSHEFQRKHLAVCRTWLVPYEGMSQHLWHLD